MSWHITSAEVAHADELNPVLCRAFAADVGIDWMLRADAHRPAALAAWFRANCALALGHGVSTRALEEDTVRGAALWVPPGKWKLGVFEQLPFVPAMVRAFGWKKLWRSQRALDFVQEHHAPEPHYYLLALGVEPSHQGRGLGKALMQPVLDRCDAERMPAFLETMEERNLPLYRSRGFEVRSSGHLPGGGPLTWFLWRAPR